MRDDTLLTVDREAEAHRAGNRQNTGLINSYVRLINSYVGLASIYVGLADSYVGRNNSYVELHISYVVVNISCVGVINAYIGHWLLRKTQNILHRSQVSPVLDLLIPTEDYQPNVELTDSYVGLTNSYVALTNSYVEVEYLLRRSRYLWNDLSISHVVLTNPYIWPSISILCHFMSWLSHVVDCVYLVLMCTQLILFCTCNRRWINIILSYMGGKCLLRSTYKLLRRTPADDCNNIGYGHCLGSIVTQVVLNS